MRPRLGVGAPLTLCVLLALFGLLAAGCGDGSSRDAPPPPKLSPPATSSPPPSPTPTRAPTEADKILAQYKAFWNILTAASRQPPEQRRVVLARYAAEPQLTRIIQGMAAQDAAGQEQYGYDVLRPRITLLADSRAQITDCQDSTKAGVRLKMGQPLTKGLARHPVVSALIRDAKGQWRISFITYPKGTC